MRAAAQRKVPGGKLLRVRLDHEGGIITSVQISGDFFLHPEDGLQVLERCLVGLPTSMDERTLETLLQDEVSSHGLEVLGFGPRDLAWTIAEALR